MNNKIKKLFKDETNRALILKSFLASFVFVFFASGGYFSYLKIAEAVTSGTITASNCTIASGASTCNTNLVWDVVDPPASPIFRVLVVGGGGGGGGVPQMSVGAGGGGGGGDVVDSSYSISVGSYSVIVGAGGYANGGSNSSFGTITAYGGGKGGNTGSAGEAGASGGGGGGHSSFTSSGGVGNQGYNGGAGFNGPNGSLGGGGGGDGGAGSTHTTYAGGNGGNGTISDITGSSVYYGNGGGGGAMSSSDTAGNPGLGSGNGGGGGTGTGRSIADGYTLYGGMGSSGLVKLRYPTGSATCTGGTVTTYGSYTIHSFNSNGTFACTYVSEGSKVTTPTGITVATGNSSAGTPYTVEYGTRTFSLYNNTVLLASATSTASCVSGSVWSGSSCVVAPTGTLSASNCNITAGNNSCDTNLSWSTSNPIPGYGTFSAKVLAIGGGGGGGGSMGGGGGAGGYQYNNSFNIIPQAYNITVGAGGGGGINAALGTNGANSIFSTITSNGGGGGGYFNSFVGNAGGSGGGGGGGNGASLGGTGSQGYAGGNNTLNYYPGAGGGAGAVGTTSTVGGSVSGGIGISNDITGTATYYAGGGGAGGYSGNYSNTNPGGLGGGGIGSSTGNGSNATTNTGGGGGGGNYTLNGGNGGSGIVIIRYLTANASCTGGVITTVGSDTVHTFTSSGTFTCIASAGVTSVVTTPTNITVATANSSAGTAYSVAYGTRDFTLSHNSVTLATATATASCVTGTSWNGASCQNNVALTINNSGPGTISGTCSGSCDIAYGSNATITASAVAGYSVVISGGCSASSGSAGIGASCTISGMTSPQTVNVNYTPWYTLNVNASGDGSGGPSGTYISGTSITLTNSPGPHYSFSSYGGDIDCGDGYVLMNINKNCTAYFNPITYYIYFNSNGGTAVSTISGNYNSVVTAPSNPTRTGYSFTGWSSAVPSTMPDTNPTLTAQWSINSYPVTFNGNGATGGTMANQSLVYNTPTALTSNAYTRTGYTFANWNTAANGSGTTYANGASYTIGAAGVTLYAQWTINSFNLNYIAGANGTLSGTTSQSVNYGASGSAVTAVPNSGYYFVNWSDSSIQNPRTDTNVTAAISVTANFAISYTSCRDILTRGASTGDGVYRIDPDGNGGNAAVQVYCDMTRDGGGWTLMLKSWYGAGIMGQTGAVGAVADATTRKGNAYKISDVDIRNIIGATQTFDIMGDQNGYNSAYSTGNYEYVILRDYKGYWRFDQPVAASATPTIMQSYRISDNALAWTGGMYYAGGGAGINYVGFDPLKGTNPQGGAGCDINMGIASNPGWYHFYMSETNHDTYMYVCNGPQHSSSFDMNHRFWVRESGMVGHWNLDEGTGTTATDTSGYGNNGTLDLAAGSAWVANSKLNGGLYLNQGDEGGAVNDVIVVPDSDSLDLDVSKSFTISTWVKPANYVCTALMRKDGEFELYRCGGAAGGITIRLWLPGVVDYTGSIAITDGEWSHIVVTYDKNSSSLKMYVNNVLALSTSVSGSPAYNTSPLGIGAYASGHYSFKGTMDEVRLYNRAISPGEVMGLYKSVPITLSYTAGANGTLTGTTTQVFNYGGSGTAVTAVPNTGYSFVNWSDGSTANPRTDSSRTSNLSVTANFSINQYALTINKAGVGTGTVTGAGSYNYNTVVTATATADANSTFSGWSGDCDASGNVTMSTTRTCTASFALRSNVTTLYISPSPVTVGQTPNVVYSCSNGYYSHLLIDWVWTSGGGWDYSGYYSSGTIAMPTQTVVGAHTMSAYCYNSDWIPSANSWYSIGYSVVDRPTVTTSAVNSITMISGVANGDITNTGFETNDKRGFVYSTSPQTLPGNVAPTSTTYAYRTTEQTGSFGVSSFSGTMTGLTEATTYYVRAYSHNPTAGYSYGNEVSFTTRPFPSIDQAGYRIYNNIDSADVGSALGPLNTASSLTNSGDSFRLRLLLHITVTDLPINGANFKLQYAEMSGSCDSGFSGENYLDVDYTSPIAFNLGNFFLNDKSYITASTVGDPTNASSTAIIPQTYVKSNTFTNSKTQILIGQDAEWDFALVDKSNSISQKSYCLRVIRADNGATLGAYSTIPQVVVARKISRSSGSINVESVGSGTTVGDDTGSQGGGTGLTQCSDGIDNDGDGKIDILDDQCHEGGILGNAYISTHDSELIAPAAPVGGGDQGGGGGDIGYFFNRINSIFRLPSLRNILLAMAFNTF